MANETDARDIAGPTAIDRVNAAQAGLRKTVLLNLVMQFRVLLQSQYIKYMESCIRSMVDGRLVLCEQLGWSLEKLEGVLFGPPDHAPSLEDISDLAWALGVKLHVRLEKKD